MDATDDELVVVELTMVVVHTNLPKTAQLVIVVGCDDDDCETEVGKLDVVDCELLITESVDD